MNFGELKAIDSHGHYGVYTQATANPLACQFSSASGSEVAARARACGVEWTVVSPLAGLLPRGTTTDVFAANEVAFKEVPAVQGLLQYVIVNPLHAQGFSTIGCNRCTTPVLPNEPKRAGRWRHLGPWSVYCGINPADREAGAKQAIELPQDVIDRILGRETDFSI